MVAASTLSPEDAERLRSFERQRHDHLARTYRDFFTPITSVGLLNRFSMQYDLKAALISWT